MKKKAIKISALLLIIEFIFGFSFANNNLIYKSNETISAENQIKFEAGDVVSGGDKIHFFRNEKEGYSGEAILLESNGHYAIIDASNPSTDNTEELDPRNHSDCNSKVANGKNFAKYIKSLGVTSLDFVIGTHNHSDHIGGIPEVCKAGKLINSNTLYIYKEYYKKTNKDADYCSLAVENMTKKNAKILNLIDKTNLTDEKLKGYFSNIDPNVQYIDRPEEDHLFESIEFNFQNFNIKLYNLNYRSKQQENTNSIVALITKGNQKILLTADMNIYSDSEQKIAKYVGEVDLLKAGHHGNGKSSNVDSLKALNPKIVVITTAAKCNTEKRFNIANAYLRQKGVKIYKAGESTVNKALVAIIGDEKITMKTYDSDGKLSVNATKLTDNPVSGWFSEEIDSGGENLKERWFYIKDDGALETGWSKIDYKGTKYWFYFNKDGIMQTKWVKVKERWYYLCPKTGDYDGYVKGAMLKGWQKITYKGKENWFYFNETGTDENPEGAMLTGWQKITYKGQKEKFYFKEETDENELIGTMLTGWQIIDGKAYYMNSSGVYEKKDTIAPTIGIKDKTKEIDLLKNDYSVETINNATIEVVLNIKDIECGIGKVQYKIDDNPENPTNGWTTIEEFKKLVIEGLKPGTYYLHIKAQDKGGNKSYATTKAITVTQKETLIVDVSKCDIKKLENKKYLLNGANTLLSTLKNNIDTNGIVKVFLNNQEIVDTNQLLLTGMNIEITFNDEKENYSISVKGDVNGDGLIDIKDILQLNKHRLNKTTLENEYLIAGDVNNDEVDDIKDILQLNKYRLGKIDKL